MSDVGKERRRCDRGARSVEVEQLPLAPVYRWGCHPRADGRYGSERRRQRRSTTEPFYDIDNATMRGNMTWRYFQPSRGGGNPAAAGWRRCPTGRSSQGEAGWPVGCQNRLDWMRSSPTYNLQSSGPDSSQVPTHALLVLMDVFILSISFDEPSGWLIFGDGTEVPKLHSPGWVVGVVDRYLPETWNGKLLRISSLLDVS